MDHTNFRHSPRVRYRSVFLSDFHMGAKAFDAGAVIDFLQSMECEYLYLVGDIIDGWKLKKRWYWTENCHRVIDELIRKASEGTKIIYLPGNHDDEVRHLMPLIKSRFLRKYGIRVKEKTVHTLANGKKFLILHGDQFDRSVFKGPLSKWSDRVYDRFMDLVGGHQNIKIKIDGKYKPFSLAKSLGNHGKRALHMLNNFESAVFRAASERGVDGLICGHTHIPVIKPIRNITYANCGSWLRFGHTALTEDFEGNLALIDWPASHEHPELFDMPFQTGSESFKIVPDTQRFRPITLQIVSAIRKTWRTKHSQKTPVAPIRPQAAITRLQWRSSHSVYKPLEIC